MADQDQGRAPSNEVTASIFLVFDKVQLFAQRDSGNPLSLKGLRMTEESAFTVTYLSNPTLGLTRYDMAYLLSRPLEGMETFGASWAEMFNVTSSAILPLAWGVQFNWSNSQRRVYGSKDSLEAVREVDEAFEAMQRHAEKTMATASTLMLLNGIMQAVEKMAPEPKPTGRTRAKPKG